MAAFDDMERHTYRLVVAGIAVGGAVVVLDIATWLFPYHSLNHDEAVYLQQAGMLLEGQLHLWPPVDDVFRPWFFVDAGDRLYPKYSPVPAAIFAVGRLLGGYPLALAGIAAANLALVAAVVGIAFDRRTGVLASLLVLGSPLFLIDSAVFLPYAPTTLLNLTFAYAYLRADRSGDRRWSAVAGVAIGLAFFARPFTAVLFAAPFIAHAVWTIRRHPIVAVHHQVPTALFGLLGVLLALGYNAVMTGSPLVFPYEAFAPRDGLGFGRRAILGHEVEYTIELALRTNRRVVETFLADWIAGGPLGTVLAAVGLATVVRGSRSVPAVIIAGLFVSVIAGNVFFWGNYNLIGELDRPGDGLVAVLGPYYHFDLLLPIGAFGAHGTLTLVDRIRRATKRRFDPRTATAVVVVVLFLGAGTFGAVTAQDLDHRFGENMEATAVYEAAYEPFADGPPGNSVVLLPTPYGDWLNHPFQPLRNEPGFEGEAVYAIDERPFAVADAFPDRRLYRYGYRGSWAPFAGSPRSARLQRVRDVSGSAVRLSAVLGIPEGAVGVTGSVETDEERAYVVASNVTDQFRVDVNISPEGARMDGDGRALGERPVELSGRDTLVVSVFVDYPGGGGLTYRLDLPVDVSGSHVRALTPRVEWCRDARACGGSATYIEDDAPDGIAAEVNLTEREHNH